MRSANISFILFSLAVCYLLKACDSCEECANQEDPAMAGVHVSETESESSLPDGDDEKQDERAPETGPTDDATEKGSVSAEEKYKALFNQYRASQLSSVQALMSLQKNEQRYSVVEIMLKQLFKVLGSAKENVTVLGIMPGDPVPEDETARHAYSKILENTALFGDIVLHLPDAVHSMYDKEEEWKLLLRWCYGFSLESGIFDGPHKIMLNLMAQEVDIIPKEPNFYNPFKNRKLEVDIPDIKKPEKKKKPKKKIPRGPKLTHTEL